jgi:signal transduction histidine kinase
VNSQNNKNKLPVAGSAADALQQWRINSIDKLGRWIIVILLVPVIWAVTDFWRDGYGFVATGVAAIYLAYCIFALVPSVDYYWRVNGLTSLALIGALLIANARGMSSGVGSLYVLTVCFAALYHGRQAAIVAWLSLVLANSALYVAIVMGLTNHDPLQLESLNLDNWPRRILVSASIGALLGVLFLFLLEHLRRAFEDNDALISELRETLNAKEREIRARKEAEEVATRSHQIENLGNLAGILAHDICNNLAVIQGNVDILRLEDEHSLYDSIEQASMGAASLSRQLLALGRKDYSQPKPFDALAELKQFEELLGRAAGDFPVSIQSTEKTAPVFADPQQLKQALLNLIINARDAMAEAGRQSDPIIISIARAEGTGRPETNPADSETADMLQFTVSDSGKGIPEQDQQQVFEPFFTTKEAGKGSGLGLYSVRHFAETNSGRVLLESDSNGTRVCICLPRIELTVAGDKMQSRPDFNGLRVLVVDDDERIATLLRHLLMAAGCEVQMATDGSEAMTLFSDNGLDLLCTDVLMPGMSGEELAVEFRRHYPGARILFCSAHIESAALKDLLANQQYSFLRKPFRADELYQSIRQLLP